VKAWTIISTSDRIEPLNAAERMRLHRKRHRNGLLCVRLLLHETEIDGLVRRGLLKPERRRDQSAVETAIGVFICRQLGSQEKGQADAQHRTSEPSRKR
jgi:hypothetical protein